MDETRIVSELSSPRVKIAPIQKSYILNRLYQFSKRMFDIIASFTALFVLSPIFVVIAIIIYMDDPKGSPFFTQERCGIDGKFFKFYKFRSMIVNAEDKLNELGDLNEMKGPVFKIKNDPRITRIGKLIRRTSIDELPQIINVLKGDMSIVGPRPPLPREVLRYNSYHRQRLSIKPGLTCFWQTTPNRNSLSFEDWVDLDIRYIRERSLLVDAKLIFKTFSVIFTCQGE